MNNFSTNTEIDSKINILCAALKEINAAVSAFEHARKLEKEAFIKFKKQVSLEHFDPPLSLTECLDIVKTNIADLVIKR